MAQRGGPFRGAIFDVDGVLVDSPHKLAWRQAFVAFPDALRFVLAVKAAGIRAAAASSSNNFRPFLQQIRLDTFAAEQRLDYDFVHDGMTLEELFDADLSGWEFRGASPTR